MPPTRLISSSVSTNFNFFNICFHRSNSGHLTMHLFVASYNGTISTLEFSRDASNNYSLCIVTSTTICGPNPSWITLDRTRGVLYCSEPGMKTGAGTLYSLSVQPDGSLVILDSLPTPIGAAHSALYSDNQALAVAY